MGKFFDLTGKRFGMLTVLGGAENKYSKIGKPIVMWKCLCDCGGETIASTGSLNSGNKTTCGCKKNREQNLIGQRYGKLKVIKRHGSKKKNGILEWECLCECGNTTIVSTKNLQRKDNPTISCGCTKPKYENLIGKRFGKLVVIKESDDYVLKTGEHYKQWLCKCDCGNEKIARASFLKNGRTSHCGCERYKNQSKAFTKDITGKKFGKLTAIKISKTIYGEDGKAKNYWLCKCDCGNYTEVQINHLSSGHTKTCGCSFDKNFLGDITRKHGMHSEKIYFIYNGMKQRCYNPNNGHYKDYGGRGIKICDEWLGENGFINFYEWAIKNGYNKEKTKKEQSIDRIDVNGNYEPSNCRWADSVQQGNNQRKTIKVIYRGREYTLRELSDMCGINRNILYGRIVKRNWDVEKAISEKARGKNEKFVKA